MQMVDALQAAEGRHIGRVCGPSGIIGFHASGCEAMKERRG